MTRRVVVTGMGVIAPNGRTVESFRDALETGRSAIGPIRRFSTQSYPTRIAAEVDDFPCEMRERIPAFGDYAAKQAVANASLSADHLRRAGVVIAAGYGTYDHEEVFSSSAAGWTETGFDWNAFHEQYRRTMKPRALQRRSPGSVVTAIARELGCEGGVMSVMTACAAGTQALGDATRWIREGEADVVVAGGSDSEIYPMGVASFCLLRALSTRNDEPERASRPFSASRDGFVLGEGAAMLVLEELEHARRRGAHIHAEILGFGSACDSYRVTDPHPEGVGAILSMRRALAQAGLSPEQIDYINAHGTSTPLNDRIESRAVRQLFGAHAAKVAVTSTKSMIGHLTVAAGAVEAVATILAMERGIAHPTVNFDDPDPDCALAIVGNEARPLQIDAALSNSFAFGGQCASIIFGRYAA